MSSSRDFPELLRIYMKMRVPKKRATAVRWETHVEKVFALPPEDFIFMTALMMSK